MTTKISIDDELIDAAMALGNHTSKNKAATAALEKYLERLQRRAASQKNNMVCNDAKVSKIDPAEIR